MSISLIRRIVPLMPTLIRFGRCDDLQAGTCWYRCAENDPEYRRTYLRSVGARTGNKADIAAKRHLRSGLLGGSVDRFASPRNG
jgi:hypothetical protein